MTFLHSIILGIVQGVTEFLPISSTGHLILVPAVFGWQEQSLVFDTTLHLGTASALLIYFRKDILDMIKSFFSCKFGLRNLGVKILIGSIPAGIIGVLFGDIIENTFRNSMFVLIFLVLGTVLMSIAEMFGKRRAGIEDLDWKKSGIIGLFQSLALLPGFSRSGSSISGGMLFGLNREAASRFSFLLSIPIVLAAGVFKLYDSFSTFLTIDPFIMLTGFLASFVSGMLAMDFLLKYLKRGSLYPFVIYRLVLILFLLLSIKSL